MRRLASSAVVLLASACFSDLLTGPEPDLETAFGVTVRVIQDEGLTYTVRGDFTPGSDANGVVRSMLDSAMTVAGSAIQGVWSTSRLRLAYTWVDSTTSIVRDTLAVRGPVLEGQTSPTTTMLIAVPARRDPSIGDYVAGEDVRLDVSTVGVAPYGFGSDVGFWQLEIRDPAANNGSLLRIQGSAQPPSPIVIPWGLVPAQPGDSLTATLQFNSAFTSVLTAYPTFLYVSGRLTWRMRIVAP